MSTALARLEARLGLVAGMAAAPDRQRELATARGLLAFVLVRRLGYRLTDVARALGRDPASLSVTVGRLARRLARDERLTRSAECLSECLEVKV